LKRFGGSGNIRRLKRLRWGEPPHDKERQFWRPKVGIVLEAASRLSRLLIIQALRELGQEQITLERREHLK
jgi:hypothetical protein